MGTTTTLPPTWAPHKSDPDNYFMHDSVYDALDLEDSLQMKSVPAKRRPSMHKPSSAAKMDEDYQQDLDSVYEYLDLDTATDHERAHGHNLDYMMNDDVFSLMDLQDKQVKKAM